MSNKCCVCLRETETNDDCRCDLCANLGGDGDVEDMWSAYADFKPQEPAKRDQIDPTWLAGYVSGFAHYQDFFDEVNPTLLAFDDIESAVSRIVPRKPPGRR